MRVIRLVWDSIVLCRVFLRSMRFWGPFTYTLSIAFPLLLLFFLVMNIGPQAHERMPFLLSGSLLAGYLGISVTSLGQYLVQLRLSGGFVSFRSLPIHGGSLVFGIVLYYLTIQLPLFALFLIVLSALGFRSFLNGFFFLSGVTCILALIPIGAFIGLYARRIEQGSVLSIAVSFLLYMCAPVYFPIDQLPAILRVVARFVPTTYLAENLRTSMLGAVDPKAYAANLAIVAGMSALLYCLMARRLRLVSNE